MSKQAATAAEAMTARQVIAALRQHHTTADMSQPWILLEELRIGTGWLDGVGQSIDLWALSTWPSMGVQVFAYEVKVSRSDFLHELRRPKKRAAALAMSTRFYFATPEGLAKPEEIPEECGLVEVHVRPKSTRLVTVVEAPWREVALPQWTFVASALRNAEKLGMWRARHRRNGVQ